MYCWGAWIDIYGNEGRGVMKGYLKYIDHYFSHDEMAEKVGLCIILYYIDRRTEYENFQ